MFNWFKKRKIRKEQDRIALEIAKQHGLESDYLAARRAGFDPYEALEDWGLLTPQAIELLNNVKCNK